MMSPTPTITAHEVFGPPPEASDAEALTWMRGMVRTWGRAFVDDADNTVMLVKTFEGVECLNAVTASMLLVTNTVDRHPGGADLMVRVARWAAARSDRTAHDVLARLHDELLGAVTIALTVAPGPALAPDGRGGSDVPPPMPYRPRTPRR